MVGLKTKKKSVLLSKAARDTLQENEERYRAFIANSTEGIWRFEVEKPISITLRINKQIQLMYKYAFLAECNVAFARMYGCSSPDDIIGTRLTDLLVQTDQNNIAYLTAFITNGYRLTNAESHEIDKDGNPKYFQNNLIGIVNNNKLIRAWGTQIDITAQKQVENEQREIERRKDEFISIASHELKTPLTTIKAFTQLMRRDPEVKKQTKIFLEKMERQLDKLTGLVYDLLDVSHLNKGILQLKKESFDITQLIKETIDNIQATTVRHKIIFMNTLPVTVYADKYRIEQVLTNLLTNAIKYSPRSKKIHVLLAREKNKIKTTVQDYGIGIPEKKQKNIFKRFYRVSGGIRDSFPGLGLGLYISNEIIKRHEGKISFKSVENKGSTFSFTLPLKN